ncbi:putative glucose-6-phosphate dehydrogenase (NADP(+)) [Helianthus debilis subsp. tardiflorus]
MYLLVFLICYYRYLTPCKGCEHTHEEDVTEFLQLIKYVAGAYDTEEGFRLLDKAISEYELSKNTTEGSSRRLFYLALPPSVYPPVCKMIKSYCMNKSDLGGWTRIVVEKPFGKDLASAEELSAQIGELFDEPQIYRIDHYLGKELMVLRFANRFFLPLWNRDNISNIQIVFREDFGTEGRRSIWVISVVIHMLQCCNQRLSTTLFLSFLDYVTLLPLKLIIRDIIQNHLLQR